jgi:hypothetical protein
MGFGMVGVLSSKGSTMMTKPLVYEDTKVAKWAISVRVEKSVWSAISIVRSREANLSAQNL